MSNAGYPTVQLGDTGDAVSQAQRALRRTPNVVLPVDGVFGPVTDAATKEFQYEVGLTPTGVIDEGTWAVLPSGDPMPQLKKGASGDAVRGLQEILTCGAPGLWQITPQGTDGQFGSNTEASVRAFQTWAGIDADGIVGPHTWNVPLALEFVVGLQNTVPEP